ncbi:MAG: AAA family ATPase, partial [Eubacteriales bacterium]
MGNMINTIEFIDSMEELLPLPVGVSGFKDAVENYYYVDKTLFIKELRMKRAEVTLITRPRRFGKTLNMNMLRCFFEKTEKSNQYLFENLNIWKCGDKHTSEQGMYPVIFLTLKDVKFASWEKTFENLKGLIAKEFDRHSYLLQSDYLSKREKVYITKVIHSEVELVGLTDSLKNLSESLHKHHKVRPIILLDEYDMPIQSGYSNDFYKDVIEFMRNWMSGGLKDNENLSFAVITGILKVAQESIFSGLNNPSICTIFDKNYNSYFGFTEDEVLEMARYYEKSEKMCEIKQWYDGYNFSNVEIYNPWSVINYFAEDCQPMSYWMSTSSNDVLKKMLSETNYEVKTKLYNLMKGQEESVTIDLSIVYPNLEMNPESIFSLLLLTGYLKAVKTLAYNKVMATCDVTIPNYEIKTVYQMEILSYVKEQFKLTATDDIVRAIIYHDTEKLNISLHNFM